MARWCVCGGGRGIAAGPKTEALEVLKWPPMDSWPGVESLEVDVTEKGR